MKECCERQLSIVFLAYRKTEFPNSMEKMVNPLHFKMVIQRKKLGKEEAL